MLEAKYCGNDRVTVRGEALSSEKGIVSLRIPMRWWSEWDGFSTIEPANRVAIGLWPVRRVAVQRCTLDSVVHDPVALIKIDVEGYELIVLQGAKRTITKYKPVVLVEINDLSKFDNIYHFLKELGYICVETWGRKKIKYKEISQFTKNINNYSFISPSLLQFGSADDKE